MTTRAIGVFGAGQMGTGIALVASRFLRNSKIYLFDAIPDSLEKSKNFMQNWTAKEIAKGKMNDASAKQILLNIHHLSTLSRNAESIYPELDFAIEAVPEEFSIKSELIRMFEKHSKPECIFATNTSSISITRIASVSARPEKVIGMHFMNPVPVMPLVEVISGLNTAIDTHAATVELCKEMQKTPANSLDRPGFIANRLLMPYINEAIFAYQDGVSSRDDIDKIMKLGTNMPMGPLELADFIGLDTCLAIMRVLHNEFGDSKYRPAPLLVQMVAAKKLGRKTKQGFYSY